MNCRSTLLLTALCLFSACSKEAARPVPSAEETEATYDREALNRAMAEVENDKLEKRLSALELEVASLETGSAWVSTENGMYDIARTKFGPFAVSSKGVTPYLDGFKVKLEIGNLTTATFQGVKLNLVWGLPPSGGVQGGPPPGMKNRDYDLTMVLRPGYFNTAEVVVAPAKPEEVKHILVGMELNELSLRQH